MKRQDYKKIMQQKKSIKLFTKTALLGALSIGMFSMTTKVSADQEVGPMETDNGLMPADGPHQAPDNGLMPAEGSYETPDNSLVFDEDAPMTSDNGLMPADGSYETPENGLVFDEDAPMPPNNDLVFEEDAPMPPNNDLVFEEDAPMAPDNGLMEDPTPPVGPMAPDNGLMEDPTAPGIDLIIKPSTPENELVSSTVNKPTVSEAIQTIVVPTATTTSTTAATLPQTGETTSKMATSLIGLGLLGSSAVIVRRRSVNVK
ncbi:LPXTG cell wall anchor domain-containing protein [Vagococcus bubulae]|uniref:LPXTG cell wall anchor domain-containing protein n=1 Tax=Vagococcus bubulae TaxID=1977868 RepID=UPI0022E58869|nr:LPXTG cell wall anchor domain-containing protein [Vagococcus bubulae]